MAVKAKSIINNFEKGEIIMEKVYAILEGIIPDVDLKSEKSLATDGYIDSFDIVTIISALEEEFGLSIPVDSMIPENFESVEAMWELICSLKEGTDNAAQ